MYQVNQITSDYKQSQTLVLPSGAQIQLYMEYKPQQLGWFMNITYGSFILNTFRVCTSANLLRQFKNILPFGMSIQTSDNYEPTQLQDFSSGYAQMFILTQQEVTQYEEFLSGS